MLRHDNAIGLVAVRGEAGEAQVTPDDLLMTSLRKRPERVNLGELRGNEAFIIITLPTPEIPARWRRSTPTRPPARSIGWPCSSFRPLPA